MVWFVIKKNVYRVFWYNVIEKLQNGSGYLNVNNCISLMLLKSMIMKLKKSKN